MSGIEDIVLDQDRRGISSLRSYLPLDFCTQAARFALENPGLVFILTGWYIPTCDAAETDGPAGALAMGNALDALGFTTHYVSDGHAASLLRQTSDPERVIEFPLADWAESEAFAAGLLDRYAPTLIISIERPGFTADGTYRNMRGVDISQHSAKLDYLVMHHPRTIGIGDGGNEIGMGNLAEYIPSVGTLVETPCTTNVDHLIMASVSNWGGYGLVAALSQETGRDLLPSGEEERYLINRLVELGAVDGVLGKGQPTVDTFTLDENATVLEQLRRIVAG